MGDAPLASDLVSATLRSDSELVVRARQGDRRAFCLISVGAQSICPGIQDRDAHRLAIGHIGIKAAALAEELHAGVGQ